MKWQAVIFDLDNTLLDRNKTFRKYAERFVDFHLGPLDMPTRERCIEMVRVADRDGYRRKPELYAELLETLPWEPARRPAHASLLAFYDAHYVSGSHLMDDAHELLAYLRGRGARLGLVTNGRSEIQRGKVERLGLEPYLDYILVSGEIDTEKPDPLVYETALAGMSVAPGDAVFIGDHPENDIMGPAGAGMDTIWLRRNQPWMEHVAARPAATFRTLRELLDYFRRL
ncbi:HAD family hydrolase [Paenibacillus cymbidii]|uniref:HAD family hydrolase n=1 Tax=Paenibacillus cymbidii TaxID=1639034 RepID=UPI0010802E34|nr:HAD family hydrolase [Paenibacillus cymbidii]